MSAQGNWATWQLWLTAGRSASRTRSSTSTSRFFAWDYPVYRLMLGFGFTAIIFALILSAVVHYLTGAIRLQTPGPKVTLAARRHLTMLVFVFIVLKAIAYWLDRYGLVFSGRSKFTGASYTDVHAVLPARTILFWIAVVIAAGLIASLWLRSTLLPGIAFVSMLVLSILISGIYPALLQQVSVKPNASSKEAPYIRRNITATRQAYGIVTGTDVDVPTTCRAATTPEISRAGTARTTDGRRHPHPRPERHLADVHAAAADQQRVRLRAKLDVDRYTINGVGRHDYIVGVRELDVRTSPATRRTGSTSTPNYTHGYGFVGRRGERRRHQRPATRPTPSPRRTSRRPDRSA